jgi:large subunit ribosomal protein L15
MKYNELQVGANKARKRVGRGDKTAGRGTKGQGARTGKKLNAMFQGGSGALVRRTPKARGFKSIRTPAQVVYLDHLNAFKGKVVDNMSLYEAGLVATPFHSVKIIARGDLTEKVTLRVQAASKSVQEAVTKAGGIFEKTDAPIRQSEKAAEAADK